MQGLYEISWCAGFIRGSIRALYVFYMGLDKLRTKFRRVEIIYMDSVFCILYVVAPCSRVVDWRIFEVTTVSQI